jgi:NAD(P)-dependent dehydrogenase (short-subunit alcohol dehydrogenase family)
MNDPGTVLITGVQRGIGAALLHAFANAGWRVHGTVRALKSEDAPDQQAGDPHVILHECDIADWPALASLAASITEPLDVVINNAATFADRAFRADELDPAEMLSAFAVNTVGPTYLAHLLKAHLLRGKRRLLVMMSTGNASLAGNLSGEMLAYRSSKSALNQVVRTLAAEWGAAGITTLALNPGWARTKLGGPNAPLSAAEAAERILSFVTGVADPRLSGEFVNVDGSSIPW